MIKPWLITALKFTAFAALVCLGDVRASSTPEIPIPQFKQLSTADGLAQDTVNDVLIGPNGYLWIATESGINRYDGYRVSRVPAPLDTLPVTRLAVDKQQRLWAGTRYSGIYLFDLKTGDIVQHIKHPFDDNDLVMQTMEGLVAETQDTNLLALSNRVVRTQPSGLIGEDIVKLHDNVVDTHQWIRAIHKAGNVLYIGTTEGLFVYHMKLETQRRLPLLPRSEENSNNKNVKSFFSDDTQVLVGTVEGLYALEHQQVINYLKEPTDTPSVDIVLPERNIWQIVKSDNGLYLATDYGLYLIENEQVSPRFLFRTGSGRLPISDDDLKTMALDKHNNLWLGTPADGVLYWSAGSLAFKTLSRNTIPELSHDQVWDLHQTQDGIVWIGTQNGLNAYDPQSGEVLSYLVNPDEKQVESASSIYKILPLPDNRLWLTSATEVGVFNRQTQTYTDVPVAEGSDPVPDYIWGAETDSLGRVWFANENGLYVYDAKSRELIQHEKLSAQFDINEVAGFLPASPAEPQHLYLTLLGGLWQIDIATGESREIHSLSGDIGPYDYPESVLRDAQGRLWISYLERGVYVLDGKDNSQIAHYTAKNSELETDTLYQLTLDDDGHIWASSHTGLYKYSPQQDTFQQFDVSQGLLTNEFNGGASVKMKNGNILFGSVKGTVMVKPGELAAPPPHQDSVQISDIRLLSGGLEFPLVNLTGQAIKLKHDDVGLVVEFTTLDFEYSQQTRFQYTLSGAKDIESPPSKEPYAVFPNLSPGQYTLRIDAMDPASGRALPPAHLSIDVAYAPWSSPLAYSLYALLVITLAGSWLYQRQRSRLRLISANSQLQENQRRLKLALTVSNSGVWEWHGEENQCYQPRLINVLGYDSDTVDTEGFFELIHPEDRQHVRDHWRAFVNQDNSTFDTSYRLKGKDGQWYWFRDLGRAVSLDTEEKTMLASGIYTNITATRINEERAKLFGEAYKNTQDWVVILNSEQAPFAANDAFLRVFGYRHESELMAEKQGFSFGVNKEKRRYYTSVISHLALNDYWQGEDTITPPDGRTRDVQVRISAVSMSPSQHESDLYYVVILTDISEQKQAESELKQLANYDTLTGLPNRSLLMDRIKQGIHHAQRYKNQMALLFIDLDKFKQVNDSMGHEAGDRLLKVIAERMEHEVRIDDTVARLGGDEFVVLSADFAHVEDITHMADRIVRTIEQPVELSEKEVAISCSIGIALFPSDAKDASALLRNADIAMYYAKESGRGHFQFFTEQMNEQAHGQLEKEQQLRQAHAQDELVNFYQPIVDVRSGRIIGFEMLLRWQREGKLVPPNEFIPLAEDMGLIVPITIKAIERGVQFLRSQHQHNDELYLSVNLSPVHFEYDLDTGPIIEVLQNAGIAPAAITFEITEGVLMRDYQRAKAIMDELKAAGFRLALDDFGTGYSSLKYLKEFPLDLLKIDKSFVADIGVDHNDEQIISTILVMAENLDMKCIAEGIETPDQRDFLQRLGCHWHQGFYYYRPMPEEACQQLWQQADSD